MSTTTYTDRHGFWIYDNGPISAPIVCPHGYIVDRVKHGTRADFILWVEQGWAEEFTRFCERNHPHAPVVSRRDFRNKYMREVSNVW